MKKAGRARAYWRAFLGYCPTCNLDAPAIDRCPSCMNYRGLFPPPDRLTALWLLRHFENLSLATEEKQ